MFLEELRKILFKDEDTEDLYLRKWIDIYKKNHPEKEERIKRIYNNFEKDASVLTDLLDRFSPEDSADEDEKVSFAYAYLCWLLKTTDDPECFDQERWESFIDLKDEKFVNVLRIISRIIINDARKEKDISDFLDALVNLANELGKESLRKEEQEIEALEMWYLDTYVNAGRRRPLTEFCNKMFEYYVCTARGDENRKKNEGSCAVNAICAEILFRIDLKEEGIDYAKKSLCLMAPAARWNAFIVLGNSCIDSGRRYWQLAYDAYYSWLNRQMTGELSDIKIDFSSEDEWRSQNKKKKALMLNNYAYLCSIIADNLVEGSKNQRIFRYYAVTSMKEAIDLEKENPGFNCTYGTLLSENGNYEKAIEYYAKYYELSHFVLDSIAALRMWSKTSREMIFEWFSTGEKKENCREFLNEKKVKEAFADYFLELEKYNMTYKILGGKEELWSKDARMESRKRGELEDILKLQEYFKEKQEIGSPIVSYIKYLLLLIDMAVNKIDEQLQKCDYGALKIDLRNQQMQISSEETECVAYYTTLDTAKYLFAELHQPDHNKAPVEGDAGDKPGKGKNCLTMMHAMYMNDPNEGLPLLQSLENCIKDSDERNNLFDGMSSVEFREGIYDRNYIFLKAFTPRVDQLDMWAMYASDRRTGSDSNGCCICLNPETFRRAIDMKNKIDDKNIGAIDSKEREFDDFHLYRVVYVGDDGNIKEEKNPHLPKKVIEYYESLKILVKALNECLVDFFKEDIPEYEKEDMQEYVRGFLQSAFKIVAFLFKEDSYFLEEELRLIITRSHEQKDLIRMLNTNPPKLCINPFFQVYIDKLILGPKVKNMDEWIPYFQYELNNMRKDGFPEQVVVRKSKIHYRD